MRGAELPIGGGIGTITFIVLLVLKLTGNISLNWFWIISSLLWAPLIALLLSMIAFLLLIGLIAFIGAMFGNF